MVSTFNSAAFSRLQDDLRLGLTCVKEIWKYEAKDWVTGIHPADINQDGDIEVLAGSRDGRVSALSRDGSQKLWECIVGEKAPVTAIVAVPSSTEQQSARVVVSTLAGKIYILDQQGKTIPPPSSDIPNATHWLDIHQPITQMQIVSTLPLSVVFAANDHHVYSFDIANNRLLWRFPIEKPIHAIFTYDVDGDGHAEILIGSDNKQLYLLSSTGELRATCLMDQAIHALYAADIDKDGEIEILVGTRTKKLFALTADLKDKWSLTLSSRPLALSIADVNSDRLPEIIVACDDQSFAILDHTGKQVWRQKAGKRYYSLTAFDLDLDGHVEILAGADDSRTYALRIQLSKDLDKKIFRSYKQLGKPDITTLRELAPEQIDLLQGILDTNSGMVDKKVSLASAKTLLETSQFSEALLSLLKLDQQKFELLWSKDQLGYLRALCLVGLTGDKRRGIAVSAPDGSITIFNGKGRFISSEKAPDGSQIIDVQSGYISSERGEDLAFASETGSLSRMKPEMTRPTTIEQFSETITCFYLLASNPYSAAEMVVGTKDGKAHLYTNNIEKLASTFDLPAPAYQVSIPAPDESGKYRNPEVLISTADNILLAYTRGGNLLWEYPARGRIMALYATDLDGDDCLEVLIGTEDRNLCVLDDKGNLRWRYVLRHSVLALETADVDNDGKREILAGCADGMLYMFTSAGDLIWRYETRDPIQALRIADIDLDGNFEIIMLEENHLEVLRIVNQQDLNSLMEMCWRRLLADRDPLDVLLPFIKGDDLFLRAAGLAKLATLNPLPAETITLLNEAMGDAFTNVRRILPEALMHAYPADKERARIMLTTLFTERTRDVRIEVVEHLELLAKYEWNEVYHYLDRAARSDERNTRRAAVRKVSHLLKDFAEEIKASQDTRGETLFRFLLTAAQTDTSTWVRQEAGRVIADFLNLFEEEFLPYLYRLFACRLEHDILKHVAYNLTSPDIRRAVESLLVLQFEFSQKDALRALAEATEAFDAISKPDYAYSTDLWLIFRELLKLFNLDKIEKLATYDFHRTPEQFLTTVMPYPHTQLFLHVGDQLNAIIPPLKIYLRRSNPDDRLSSLLESISELDAFQRLLDREYNVSPLPGALQPYLPEFGMLKALVTQWQELFSIQRNELHGHAELQCDLQSRSIHLEETVGIWLRISNHGRAPAYNVKVTLLSDESFTTSNRLPFVEINTIQAGENSGAEFVIKPTRSPVMLPFEVTYDDAEYKLRTELYKERLHFIERPQTFIKVENPYNTGTPIHNSQMCYGRETPLNYLQDNLTRITAQTVLVLYGQRRSGKTTLLKQLAQTELLAQHIPVFIDLQKWTLELNVNKFFFAIAQEIFVAMSKKHLAISKPHLQDFFGPLEDPSFSFECFLDQVEGILGRSKLILLLDEFEELEEHVKQGNLKPEIFRYLRSLMQRRPYIHFLLSGTHQIEKLTRDYWSVFFNIAHHYPLPSKIPPEGAEALIAEPVAGHLEYEPYVVNKIRQLTADQPYMIQLLCRTLIDHCNKEMKNYATLNDVNLVLTDVVITGTFFFGWLWDRFATTPQQQLLLQIIAEGSRDESRSLDLDDIKRIYHQYHYPYRLNEVSSALNTLWLDDVIEKNQGEPQEGGSDGTRYTLANGLLRRWLKQEKPLKAFQEISEADQKQLSQPLEDADNDSQQHAPSANPLLEDEVFPVGTGQAPLI